MKSLILLLLCVVPAVAWGPEEKAAADRLLAERAEIEIIGGAPLLDLMADRDRASLPVEINGRKFLASVVFDSGWETWFTLKPVAGLGAGAWREADLAAGTVYNYGMLKVNIRKAGDIVTLESAGAVTEISISALLDLLYEKSLKVTFGGIVTYAVFRNLEPLTESEGTVSLRAGSDGLYYYSLTPDRKIEACPRWLLAVNGVLYGLRVDAGSLLFVSKVIDMEKPVFVPEGALRR